MTFFFLRFHIYVLAHGICFSLSDLLHSVWQTLGPPTSLQITQFRFFLWLSNIPLYIYKHQNFISHRSGEPTRFPVRALFLACIQYSCLPMVSPLFLIRSLIPLWGGGSTLMNSSKPNYLEHCQIYPFFFPFMLRQTFLTLRSTFPFILFDIFFW